MGDRANIYLEMPTTYELPHERAGIYLYTHWSGTDWPERLRKALLFGQGRWGDDSYLARIVTSHLFADIADQETGGGMSLMLTDNQHPITVVDVIGQTVSFANEGDEADPAKRYGAMGFKEYVAQARATYPSE